MIAITIIERKPEILITDVLMADVTGLDTDELLK